MKTIPKFETTLLKSSPLFLLALKAAERSKIDRRESISAIILSAISFEAFINELEDTLSRYVSDKDPISLKTLKYFLRDLEDGKASIKLKVHSIFYILTQSIPKKGELPYQDFSLLIDLRNYFVHSKPETFIWDVDKTDKGYDHHKLLKKLASRKVIKLPKSGQRQSSSQYILCHEVADWACVTVEKMIKEIVAVIPRTTFDRMLSFLTQSTQNI